MLPRREDALRGSKKGAKTIRDRALKRYNADPVHCYWCDAIIEVRDDESPSVVRKRRYCGHSCAASDSNTGRIRVERLVCPNCKNDCGHKKFCNRLCQQQFQYDDYIRRWKAGVVNGRTGVCDISNYIRRYLFEKYGSKCHKCGWAEVHSVSGNIPLQVNHINGNCLDNVEMNLELICPNCHSLTPTFGSMNNQVGRRVLLRKK